MSFENSNVFNKENLDTYLKALGKEYSKLGGRKMPAELILIGGAAILENYGFRDMTTDVDAIIHGTPRKSYRQTGRRDEALKAADQMAWVRRMNNIRNRAEEVVLNEIVYV